MYRWSILFSSFDCKEEKSEMNSRLTAFDKVVNRWERLRFRIYSKSVIIHSICLNKSLTYHLLQLLFGSSAAIFTKLASSVFITGLRTRSLNYQSIFCIFKRKIFKKYIERFLWRKEFGWRLKFNNNILVTFN